MYIDQEACIACRKCIPTCPVWAIRVDRDTKRVIIDQDLCVECGACYRSQVCEQSALVRPSLDWPRSIRRALSDPLVTNVETRVPGRGTEEMKTNDVTGRYKPGQAGIGIELGRPGVSTSLADVQKVTMACARWDVHFAENNPVTHLMTDTSTGELNPEVLEERVLSAIVEFEVALRKVLPLLRDLREVSTGLDTVFSVDFIGLVEPDESIPAFSLLEDTEFALSPNGKNNMGLGKPAYNFFGDKS